MCACASCPLMDIPSWQLDIDCEGLVRVRGACALLTWPFTAAARFLSCLENGVKALVCGQRLSNQPQCLRVVCSELWSRQYSMKGVGCSDLVLTRQLWGRYAGCTADNTICFACGV